ncbi:MAG: hypothetical protein GWQ05_10915 [Verrucomicrobiaceae bacterium]|nr:hypothetical protein [Verrucomicrobiaceae bacterium]
MALPRSAVEETREFNVPDVVPRKLANELRLTFRLERNSATWVPAVGEIVPP